MHICLSHESTIILYVLHLNCMAVTLYFQLNITKFEIIMIHNYPVYDRLSKLCIFV